ncbi:MAG: amidohydrolase, partial [Gammaproteobacteria bacterium]
MKYRFDPEGQRLPIKLDSTSNAEYAPIPLEARNRRANALAQESATANAKRLGVPRRAFLIGAAGAATSLLAMNRANAEAGR